MEVLTFARPARSPRSARKLWRAVRYGLTAPLVSRRAWIFVVGCGHSGTTLVATLLGSHPDAGFIPVETGAFATASRFSKNPMFQSIFARAILFEQLARSGVTAATVVEKTPRHVLHVAAIQRMFPHSKVVVCVRDPRDVVASLMARGYSLEAATARWVSETGVASALDGQNPFCIVRYEDLVQAPEAELRRICESVGLPYTSVMDRNRSSAPNWFGQDVTQPQSDCSAQSHEAHRNWQVHEPISARSVGRHRNELSPIELAAIEKACNSLAERFGYEMGRAN